MNLPKELEDWKLLFAAYENDLQRDGAFSSLFRYLREEKYLVIREKFFIKFGSKDSDQLFKKHYSKIYNEGRMLLKKNRAYVIWQALVNVANLQGNTIEVGVYRGGSSVFIKDGLRLLNDSESTHFAIDTFSGHSASDLELIDVHESGNFNDVDFMEVSNYLYKVKNIKVIQGSFSQVSGKITDEKIKFVHLDTDLYKSTLDVLGFVTPRLIAGGIVVVDDYKSSKCPGVERAVQEFINENSGIYSTWGFGTEQIVMVKN